MTIQNYNKDRTKQYNKEKKNKDNIVCEKQFPDCPEYPNHFDCKCPLYRKQKEGDNE